MRVPRPSTFSLWNSGVPTLYLSRNVPRLPICKIKRAYPPFDNVSKGDMHTWSGPGLTSEVRTNGDITKMFSSSDKMHLDLLSEDEAADGERKKESVFARLFRERLLDSLVGTVGQMSPQCCC